MTRPALVLCLTICLIPTTTAFSQGENRERRNREPESMPPAGTELSAEDRQAIEAKLQELDKRLESLRTNLSKELQPLLLDVEIFSRGVTLALQFNEFFKTQDMVKEVQRCHQVLDEGLARAAQLAKGEHPWTTQKGLVVRGYRSKLDDTILPYGVRIPESYQFDGQQPFRCDLLFHGMHKDRTDMRFCYDRMTWHQLYRPENAIVLHPYGRYCNPYRLAGEVDVLEALEAAKKSYRIDEDRIACRGFSMGGNGCWHMTIHHAGLWFAANPGAGWAETFKFKRFDRKPEDLPSEMVQKLWRMYDVEALAVNLRNIPTVAYSGDRDGQKQAADVMAAAAAKENIVLTHIIGLNTGHDVNPESKTLIELKLDQLAKAGRERVPEHIRYATFTLKYNTLAWITINGLDEHWERAQVNADILRNQGTATGIKITTDNINDLTVQFRAGEAPFDVQSTATLSIDGSEIPNLKAQSDRSFAARFLKEQGIWKLADSLSDPLGLAKRPDLQGPIDDAFTERFLFVRPTGSFTNSTVEKWVTAELDRAVLQWLRFFRGDVRIKNDTEVTEDDMQDSNLILWGDPSSNSVLKKVLADLPLKWDEQQVAIGDNKFDAAGHVPILVYPNPLNPKHYVVLNSGFTFREAAMQDPAAHSPALPDWAIIDLSEAPGPRRPGKIAAADLFDEHWQVKKPKQ